LKDLVQKAAARSGIRMEDIDLFLNPNISSKDREKFTQAFGLPGDDSFGEIRRRYGHIQGTDFVINLSRAIDDRNGAQRGLAAFCSHGWGFSYGAMIAEIRTAKQGG
jgi:3-oxoacyl-[acyl-carrier-protein] synthase III